ncbi:MAG: 4Fe-4S binding protein [Nitrospinota bacterium]
MRLLCRWVAGLLTTSLVLLAGSVPARAHGGAAISAEEAGAGFLEVGRYQLLLERNADPLTAGRTAPLTVRIARRLATGREVLLAVKLPQIVLPKAAEDGPIPPPPPAGAKPEPAYLASPPQWTAQGRADLSDFTKAVEVTPGHYRIFFRPTLAGPHFLKVALLGDENPGNVTLTQFSFRVAAPPGWNGRFLAASGLFVLMTLAGGAIVSLRRRFPDTGWAEINLLDLAWLRRFFQWKYFQPVFQIPLLIFFVVIVILGLFDTQDAGRNLATRLTWTVWWAGIIFTFVLVGRVWCMMCPYGAVTEWTSRAVRPRRKFPKPLRNLWLANITFIGLTWADGYFGLVGSPRATAWFLLLILLVAVGVGALFPRRTFCRYVCPIGGLIGLYSMLSPLHLRARDPQVCKAGKEFDCYMGNDRGYGCPMFEDPRRMDTNLYCSFCGECVKTCMKSNITLRFRPFAQDLWATVRGRADEATMAVALVGVTLMATGHMIRPWHRWMDSLAAFIPFRSWAIVDHSTIEGILYTAVLLGAVVAVRWSAAEAGRRLAGNDSPLTAWGTMKVFGYMFVPLGLAAHLSHNLLHLMQETPMVVPVFQKTVNAYTPLFLGRPDWGIPPLMKIDAVYWLQMGTFLLFFAYTLIVGYRLARRVYADGSTALRALSPMVLLALGFAILNVFFLSQGMNPRHAH